MKNKNLIYSLVVIFSLLTINSGCHPDKPIKPYNPTNGLTTAVFNPDKKYGTVYDIDGNEYKTIKIGTQTWMAENLRTMHYQNGDSIPNIIDTAQWARLESGAWCNYNNTNSLDTIATYGRLYNFYAVDDSRKLAPKGWRVADAGDWNILIDYLGGPDIASNKMKEKGNLHWADAFESDNSSGFTALPGGSRWYTEDAKYIEFYAVWWTYPQYNNDKAPFLYLFYYDSIVYRGTNFKKNGYSIRCIKE
jgi:uncharacterized protein (TIGR02145 family)